MQNHNWHGGHGSIRSRDQIPVKVRVRELFYFTKCLAVNLENTTENDKEHLSTSFE